MRLEMICDQVWVFYLSMLTLLQQSTLISSPNKPNNQLPTTWCGNLLLEYTRLNPMTTMIGKPRAAPTKLG